ncbi:MAG: dTDP-4-dehydrorhamnose reductase [Tissierellales bacterium]|nr:dTDP-4-dehydrorhamnose reductase [Tissierellales bacterium]MBN2828192.1 dTDP-4-dehydrorhamnose reductase [Tissierellales bacterium]
MMKVLVTGAYGQLGFDVIKRLDSEGIEFLGTDRDSLDITNEEQVKRGISDYNPDVVIHCAAYTAVDQAEDERELCYLVNVLGTKYVAEACKEIDAKMVYISTDYVFDGGGDKPFEVTDKPNPINYYGKTKYEGELEVQKALDKYFVVRISWVFGSNGNNFVKTMLRLGKERDEISVVVDQIGSPTYTPDLAKLLVEMVKTDKYGVYHATNEGYCSWYEFACEIFKLAGMDVKVIPIKTEDYPTRAKRPRNSRLCRDNLSIFHSHNLGTWHNALRRYIDAL